MTKIIPAVIVCPFKSEVREMQIENSLEEFQRICGGSFIQSGILINRRDVLYVADIARWREYFKIDGTSLFLGCGFVTGGDGASGSMERSATVPLQETRRVVRSGNRNGARP